MNRGYSHYSPTDPDDDLPASRQFNDMRHIRQVNRRKAAEASPKLATTPQERLLELEGLMNRNIDEFFSSGGSDEYARLEKQLQGNR